MLRNLKLRTRLTLFMALILFCVCSVLTFTSTYSAQKIYQPLLMSTPSSDGGKKETVLIENMDAERDKMNSVYRAVNFICIALVFVVGTGMTYIMAGKVLSPITKLSRDIETIDENNLFMPLLEVASKDEVSRLSISFNSMIKKLEKAFISQKNFSANAAHELKTPLAAMISRIEVCQLDDNPSLLDYKDTLNDVLQCAGRMNELVGDLLEMTTTPITERSINIDLTELLEQVIHEVSQSNPKGIHFENKITNINLMGDRALLYRAFLNIMQNAVKYNKPDGSVSILANADDGKAIITISDSGIGIPADQLDRIFEPFYCVDKSRSRQLGGSGLGLALVKTIIEKHGGDISADSELGENTDITVTLPI